MSRHQSKSPWSSRTLITVCAIGCALLVLSLSFSIRRGRAQSGALIPITLKAQPDPSILSLQTMQVDIRIDNQHARVRVLQIFASHVPQVLEGQYLFALPPQASVSDFAVWDGASRIPGVMMEKRRASQIYSQIKQEQVDPGLLEQDDEHGGHSAFSAKVFPIPGYGTKRLELEYTEMLPVEGLTSHFTFPLKPSFGSPQRVGEFKLRLQVLGDYPISPLPSGAYQMKTVKAGPNEWEYEFQASDLELKEDFSFDYTISVPASALSLIAYRAPERISAYDLRDPALAAQKPDGYFEARALFNERGGQSKGGDGKGGDAPRQVILLLDTSLSMYGEKLARAVEAIDYFLHGLKPQDQFNLVLFNEEVSPLSATPLPATPEEVERALAFVKGSMLYGGTDLGKALLKAVSLASAFPAGERSVVLVSDANPTLGTINIKRIAQAFDRENNSETRPKTRLFAFAVGSDANHTLLDELARKCHGYLAQARETEDLAVRLKLFFDQVGRPDISGLRLVTDNAANFYQVYPTHSLHSFDGSSFAFVGRYRKPQSHAALSVQGQYGNDAIRLSRDAPLPELDATHEHLPRLWARARVDALLYEMNLDGEREDYIAEIIRLSQKYKFVTPYTAFLAAPRALLRPRVIQPGDPVIRVRTDASITSIFAVLPFGETLPLKFLPAERVWEVRFLAPPSLPDGTYRCRLLMTDRDGHGYQEEKSFVIDSHPPKLKASVQSQSVRSGDELLIRVAADGDTMRLVAKMYGAQPVQLFWSGSDQANVGRLRIPAGLAAGQYTLTISAEDFAHNQSSVEVSIEVLGRS
ncbi:MAG TPA: VIT and VWA domain-containing protein [Blastocatellia bacterium]|nr:VIT and VWA domain-containing protein [Blastocatellia bacterium]